MYSRLRSSQLRNASRTVTAQARAAAVQPAARRFSPAVAVATIGTVLSASLAYSSYKSPLHLDDDKTQYWATTGRKRDSSKPIFSRDDVTVVVLVGGPRAGKSEQAGRIAERFNFQVEHTDSDFYSDIALNLPTAHLSSPAGVGKLRVLIDNPFAESSDPLKDLEWFEKTIAPVCVVVFVDCPSDVASKRGGGGKGDDLKGEYEKWNKTWEPVIKHYRYAGNILEITGQWPADEQWEQVEAKLESALELEERGEL